MLLLPPPKDSCPVCAHKHDPAHPHNAQTMYYQYRFYGLRGRWPTWADAAAHCTPEMVEFWKDALGTNWTEPPEGTEVIADPPAESLHQAIGDINAPNFAPPDE